VRFHSILFHLPPDSVGADEPEERSSSAYSSLDQILASMIVGRQEYDHKPFSCTPLGDAATDRFPTLLLSPKPTGSPTTA